MAGRAPGYSREQATEIANKWDVWSAENANKEGKAAVSGFVAWLKEQGTLTDKLPHKPFDQNNVGKILKDADKTNMRTRKAGGKQKPSSKAAKSQLSLLVAAFKTPAPEKQPENKREESRVRFSVELEDLESETLSKLEAIERDKEAYERFLAHVKRVAAMNAGEERPVDSLRFMLQNPGRKTPEEQEEDSEAAGAHSLDTSEAQAPIKDKKKGKR